MARKYCTKSLSKEDWECKDAELGQRLKTVKWTNTTSTNRLNPYGIHRLLFGELKRVFSQEFLRPKPNRDRDPLEQFLKGNLDHPEMPYLLTALEWGDDDHSEKIIRHINTDNWRDFIANVNKANTRAIFAHLARLENRKQKNFNGFYI